LTGVLIDLRLPRVRAASADALAWRASLVLMLVSGFAGLGYQIVWTQQAALWLGHESAAVLAVVAAFFAGLALGAFVAGPSIERSSRPTRWYIACELVIALWSLALIPLMPPLADALLTLTGAQPAPAWQWLVAFVGTFLALMPATAAMGATLPAIERVTAALRGQGRSIAAHYASNTFGAVIGVLVSAFWLVPALGLSRTALVCAALNLLCAAVAWVVLPQRLAPRQAAMAASPLARRSALARLTLTGLLGIGYEVMVVRVLSEVAEDTVYTFAMLLAIYLLGSALGAAIYQRRLAGRVPEERLANRLLGALSIACLLGTASLWAAEWLKHLVLTTAGASMATALVAEAALALAAFGLPTIAMGALFGYLSAAARGAGASFGSALGFNTLGAALAPILFGVVLTPAMGPKLALLAIALGYLLLATRTAWRSLLVWAPAAVGLALWLLAPPLAFIELPEGGRVVSYREGAMAAVSVVEDAEGVLRLRINNRQQEGSSATRLVDGRQALLPLLLHPAPHHALFLGLGTGITAASAAEDPTLQVDAVELLPEVIASTEPFMHAIGLEAPNPRLRVMASDARRYVRASRQQYDVIVSDNFHPARSGSGALYTVEHFRAVGARLSAEGLYCQWLPLHQLDLPTLRSIVQAFVAVYPDATALLASNSLETPVLGLIGHAPGLRYDLRGVGERLSRSDRPSPPAAFGIEDEYALLGSFVAGPQALKRFAADAEPNTDDHPVVSYRAPRVTYAPESRPRDRLAALLREFSVEPDDVLGVSTDAGSAQRLASYWRARNLFIDAGLAVRPSTSARAMLAQVRQPLLAALQLSPDFRPAYDPLLRMATALASSDPPVAEQLLQELMAAQPRRPEAARLAATLASESASNLHQMMPR